MKHGRLLLLGALIAAALSACKSKVDEFGYPVENDGFFSRKKADERADWWHEKRRDWAKREDEKWDRIFDRAGGNF